jgi:lantibiotic modifying enzyme
VSERAGKLLRVAVTEADPNHELDLIGGSAGAIVGLVVLADMLDDRSLVVLADRLGDDLLRKANRSGDICSWPSPAFPQQRDLTGYSHGTAGIAAALIDLYDATGDSRYRAAAEQAFNYERLWFDRDAGNWPDFRDQPARRARAASPPTFETFWCHGAPGIALSRLRAYRTLRVEEYKAEALIALRTTSEFTASWLRSGRANFSLCHGLGGNAEVLRYGQDQLGREAFDGEALCREIAHFGGETYAGSEGSWPSGTAGSDVPGLMLGLAGIGHFYLTLHEASVPSPLCISRSSEWITPGGARRATDAVGAPTHG